MPNRVITKTMIRNAKWLDFVKAIFGIIILFLMFLILCYFGIDGYLIYAVVTYTGFLAGTGWGLFFKHIFDNKIKMVVK
jgi:hypothetical protein